MLLPAILLTIESPEDQEFMAEFYVKYHALFFHTARKCLGGDSEVEDVVHGVFEKFIDKIPKLKELNCYTLPSYVVISVRRACINHLKRKGVQNQHIVYMDDMLANTSSDVDVEQSTMHKFDTDRLHDALLMLPEDKQDILEYKYFMEMSDDDIAPLLGIKKESVRVYVQRARKALLELMWEEEEKCESV